MELSIDSDYFSLQN